MTDHQTSPEIENGNTPTPDTPEEENAPQGDTEPYQPHGADLYARTPKIDLGGRPTKLNQVVWNRAVEYLNNYRELGQIIPSNVGLALHLNISESTLYLWSQQNRKPYTDEELEAMTDEQRESIAGFSDILGAVKQLQHMRLINGGVSGDLNSTITKLILTKHDYSDRMDQTLAGNPEGAPIKTDSKWTVEFVNPTPKDDNPKQGWTVPRETSDATPEGQ